VYAADVEVRAGQSLELQIPVLASLPSKLESSSVTAAGVLSMPSGPPLPEPAPPPAPSDGTSAARIGPLPLALVAGGVGLVVTSIVTGQVSAAARRELEHECGPYDAELGHRPCPPSSASTKSRMDDYALATDVLWITGAVVAGVGITLFVLDQNTPEPVEFEAGCFSLGCGLSAAGSF
jgi:hypothetical protein